METLLHLSTYCDTILLEWDSMIRKQEMVENGQIAAVLVEGGNTEATLKRFYFSGNTVMLNAENPSYAPLVYVGEEIENVHVIGLAVAFTHIIK